ncbi:MAG: helix-turn-helix domain-containing protein [Reinekea sp.]|nr:helix-turn-helix domain-containing protein [Reinekea sp.]
MKIAFVLYPQLLTTGVSVPVEMFNAANQAMGRLKGEQLQIHYVAQQKGAVTVAGGIQLVADNDFGSELDVDWVFLPPMWGTPWRVMHSQVELSSWLHRHYLDGARIVATGTGVCIAAHAGLLDDRIATTHWYYMPKFRKRFPRVRFQTEHFITHQDGIYCAGSINAQTDLVLFFIERHFGEDALALVEQQFMHELKRNFTTPYYEPGGNIHDDEVVSLVQSWLRSHVSETVNLGDLANVAGHSERQLRRRFVNATGESPMQYLQRIRIEEAQSLLRESNLSVTDIALAVGFSNPAYFARTFRKVTSMSAGEYRKMVRKKSFTSL